MTTNGVNRRQTSRLCLLGAIVLSAGWLLAIPGHASTKGKWSDDVSRELSFSRILVVGISTDRNLRCGFERVMASMIRSTETAAIVSCDVIPQDTALSRESIEAALAEEDADAVLTTSLVTSSWASQEGGTRDTRGGGYYKATDIYYGLYGGTAVAFDFRTSDPITTVRGKVDVATLLYDTRDATLVYTLDTRVRDVKSTEDGLLAISAPISKRLRRVGLID